MSPSDARLVTITTRQEGALSDAYTLSHFLIAEDFTPTQVAEVFDFNFLKESNPNNPVKNMMIHNKIVIPKNISNSDWRLLIKEITLLNKNPDASE